MSPHPFTQGIANLHVTRKETNVMCPLQWRTGTTQHHTYTQSPGLMAEENILYAGLNSKVLI